MKTIRKITILLIVATSFSGCKFIVGTATRDWKKSLIQSNNDRYHLDVKFNLSGGCPQSSYLVSTDSVIIKNGFLTEIIYHLTDKSASRVEFSNITFQKDIKLDIAYYPDKNSNMRANNDTLLQKLADKLQFSITDELQSKTIYDFSIADSVKLLIHKDSTKTTKIRTPKGMIEFYGCTLKQICNSLENSTKLLINCQSVDTNRYRMMIPIGSANQMKTFFENECGIKIIEEKKAVNILKIKFTDK